MNIEISQVVALSDRHIAQICDEEEVDRAEEEDGELERLVGQYVARHADAFAKADNWDAVVVA